MSISAVVDVYVVLGDELLCQACDDTTGQEPKAFLPQQLRIRMWWVARPQPTADNSCIAADNSCLICVMEVL